MGELTDLIFSILGKLARWFNIRGQRICFVLWAICLIYWMARNFQMNLIVQTLGCLVSFFMHCYGFWNWKNKGIGN